MPAFARKLAGFPVGQPAVQQLQNGKRSAAATGSEAGAEEGGFTAGSGRVTALGRLAVVPMGDGLLAAVFRLAGGKAHAAAQLAAGSNGDDALLLGPVTPRHGAACAGDEQQDGQAAGVADTGSTWGPVRKGKLQKKRVRPQGDAGSAGVSPTAAGSSSGRHAGMLLRVAVVEEAYGCVQALHEAALGAPPNGRLQDAAALGSLQASCCRPSPWHADDA